MPYVKRNENGQLIAIATEPLAHFSEFMEDNNDELKLFIQRNNLEQTSETLNALQDSDKAIARITEDLISLLIEKKTILFTELPEAVQYKLLQREKLRASHTKGATISFLDNDESI